MKELYHALELRHKYNQMNLMEVVREFEQYTGQSIPNQAIEDFRFMGLNNIDFLTSDHLNEYGLKNLLQFENP